MTGWRWALVLAACAGIWPALARAEFGALDDVPAATLLLPYFEVSLADPNHSETIFSIHNVDLEPVAARVTLWSDRGVPLLAFDVRLTPFDVEEINLRDVFDGRYPNASVLSCGGEPSPIAGSLAELPAGTTGQPIERLGGQCAGSDFGDGVARGYLTVDATPCDEPLSAGAGGTAGFTPVPVNVLWGDYRIVHREQAIAVGELLVALEHSVGGTVEPFPRVWGARYLNLPGTRTDLIVWRDVSINGELPACGPPVMLPAPAGSLVIFDDNQNSIEPALGLPDLTAARVAVGTDLQTPFTSGWIALDLQATQGGYVTVLQIIPPLGMAIRGVDLSGAFPPQ